MDENMLLSFAVSVGEVMLESGAETHRVEDTVERILSVGKNTMPETFITPTGLFASIHSPMYGTITKFKRISTRSINLEKVTKANSLSRDFVSGKISLIDGFTELEKISTTAPFKHSFVLFCYGMLCFVFTLLFNGSITDAMVSFVVGVMLGVTLGVLAKNKTSPFLISLLGGGSIALYTMIFYALGLVTNYEAVLTGAIMPLVPGVAITNAVRDIMNGDFLSGATRGTEAIITAVAVATSVGVILSISSTLGVV